jgi:hypothetical protein
MPPKPGEQRQEEHDGKRGVSKKAHLRFFRLRRSAPAKTATKATCAMQSVPAGASRILAEATFTTAVWHD